MDDSPPEDASAERTPVHTPCKACGAPLSESAHFCGSCGAPTLRARKTAAAKQAASRIESTKASWVVAGISLGVFLAILIGAVVSEALPDLFGAEGLPGIFAQYAVMAGVGLLTSRVSRAEDLPAERRYRIGPKDLAFAILAGGLGWLVSHGYVSLVQGLLTATDPMPGSDESAAAADWIAILVLAPLFEEWLCRDILWSTCARHTSPKTTLALTSTVFAMLHAANGLFLLEVPHRLAAGFLFGLLRLRTGSVLAAILAHFTLNFLAVVVSDG